MEIKNTQITLDSFQPLIEAMEARDRCISAFYASNRQAQELLLSIENRQEDERRKLSDMRAELKAEEQALRKRVKDTTANRARAILDGRTPPETDIDAGARLAAIPDEIAALDALMGEKRMTDGEQQAWRAAISELRAAADEYKRAHNICQHELIRWKIYFYEASRCSTVNTSFADLINRAYELNQTTEKEEDEEEPDDEAEIDTEAAESYMGGS